MVSQHADLIPCKSNTNGIYDTSLFAISGFGKLNDGDGKNDNTSNSKMHGTTFCNITENNVKSKHKIQHYSFKITSKEKMYHRDTFSNAQRVFVGHLCFALVGLIYVKIRIISSFD